ncbi:OLC1v1004440C1 [Oldenlandia corymbosa var. corymbosa]|uniref:OLC1v1004440C1 n=1 Tax=Oldenlandia corymbosa var. corymbosa TaxID=529605 RepID=A0AAV1DCA8_OLDCO|nr:OLC1v1004440C1 [Oldenlandia corymbosa var. corymbosa]
MDYSLAALKLLCMQLKSARHIPSSSPSNFILGDILFQRAWVQGIVVSIPTPSSENGRFLLDDGTGIIEILLTGEFLNRHWETGMYLMVVGGYSMRPDDLPFIKAHKMVDLSAFPDRESMWYLEVIEAFKLFYHQTL